MLTHPRIGCVGGTIQPQTRRDNRTDRRDCYLVVLLLQLLRWCLEFLLHRFYQFHQLHQVVQSHLHANLYIEVTVRATTIIAIYYIILFYTKLMFTLFQDKPCFTCYWNGKYQLHTRLTFPLSLKRDEFTTRDDLFDAKFRTARNSYNYFSDFSYSIWLGYNVAHLLHAFTLSPGNPRWRPQMQVLFRKVWKTWVYAGFTHVFEVLLSCSP